MMSDVDVGRHALNSHN